MVQTTMERLRSGLESMRGRWPEIARDTGVDYFTIARIARGDTADPRISSVDSILGWLAHHPVNGSDEAA